MISPGSKPASRITIEIIGDSNEAVEDEGDGVVDRRRSPEQEYQQWHRKDARKREQIRQRQHLWVKTVIRFGAMRKAGYAAEPSPMNIPAIQA